MRKELLDSLNQAIQLQTIIETEYKDFLSELVIQSGRVYIDGIIGTLNNIIKIANTAEGKETFSNISNIDEAIKFLENETLDAVLLKAVEDNNIGFSAGKLGVKDFLEISKQQILNAVDHLKLNIAYGKINQSLVW